MDEGTPTHTATRSGDEPPAFVPARGLQRGDAVGRYLVVDRVGAGAMGVVYSAYDPELDRRVALKVLHEAGGDGSSAAAGRLRREAQALAKLSHPAVVGVHDVGATDGRIFIAMEFVEGITLSRWRAEAPRGIHEVLAVMREAGRGLAAAHAAGLMHRDFKPENVMIDRTGRVRVLDFGLARASRTSHEATDDARPVETTQVGAVIGTPAYMAPEQLAGLEIDARADQFAFAVTLWELCHAARPFRGTSLAELATNVLEGRFAEPGRTSMPAWVRRIVLRGLSPRAEDRWPSMEAMLDALGRDPTRTRRRWLVLGGGLAVLAGAIAWQQVQRHRSEAACVAEGAALDAVWNDETRARTHDAIVAADADRGELTWTRLEPRIDAYAEEWGAARLEACRAGRVEHTRSEVLTERAADCLDARRYTLDGVLRGLAHADALMAANAIVTFSQLARIETCRDEQALLGMAPPTQDPETRARIDDVGRRLAEARVQQLLGRYEPGRALAASALDDALAIGEPHTIANAELRLAIIAGMLGDSTKKRDLLDSAYFRAGATGADEISIEAAISLVICEGLELAHPERGLAWAHHAQMLLDRMNEPSDTLRRANLAAHRGVLLEAQGRYEDALREHVVALAARERWLGGDAPEVAASLGAIGLVYYGMSDYATSAAYQLRALELRERLLGADHRDVAGSLNNLALAELAQGSFVGAAEHFRRATAIIEREHGPTHPDVGSEYNNLGVALRAADDLAGASAAFERAVSIWRKSLGPDHPDLAMALDNLGINERMLGHYDQALAHHEAALALRERTLGPEHRDTGVSLAGIGRTELARGRVEQALAVLERSIVIGDAQESDPGERGSVRFALARALWQQGADRPRALALAHRAREELRRGAEANAAELAELDRWLQQNE